MQTPETLFLIAGNGSYPQFAVQGARESGVKRIVVAAFEGETYPALPPLVDEIHWMKVGQLGRLIETAKKSGATASMMAGQIAPKHLFDLRPDIRALILLATLRERNAETLFGAIAGELEKAQLLFEKLLGYANHVGLYSEELGANGRHLGNFPQAFTHLALISAATYLDRALSGTNNEEWY